MVIIMVADNSKTKLKSVREIDSKWLSTKKKNKNGKLGAV